MVMLLSVGIFTSFKIYTHKHIHVDIHIVIISFRLELERRLLRKGLESSWDTKGGREPARRYMVNKMDTYIHNGGKEVTKSNCRNEWFRGKGTFRERNSFRITRRRKEQSRTSHWRPKLKNIHGFISIYVHRQLLRASNSCSVFPFDLFRYTSQTTQSQLRETATNIYSGVYMCWREKKDFHKGQNGPITLSEISWQKSWLSGPFLKPNGQRLMENNGMESAGVKA